MCIYISASDITVEIIDEIIQKAVLRANHITSQSKQFDSDGTTLQSNYEESTRIDVNEAQLCQLSENRRQKFNHFNTPQHESIFKRNEETRSNDRLSTAYEMEKKSTSFIDRYVCGHCNIEPLMKS